MERGASGTVWDMASNALVHNATVLALPPTPDASRSARLALGDLGIPEELAHTVTLLTSEIVGNSVRHADMAPRDRILLSASISGDHARIEVADTGAGFDPEVRHAAEGYGLRLLDQLASRWGSERGEHGSRVWFEVDCWARRFARA